MFTLQLAKKSRAVGEKGQPHTLVFLRHLPLKMLTQRLAALRHEGGELRLLEWVHKLLETFVHPLPTQHITQRGDRTLFCHKALDKNLR
jgi:hypothetical protein